jgi:hypothetical protein
MGLTDISLTVPGNALLPLLIAAYVAVGLVAGRWLYSIARTSEDNRADAVLITAAIWPLTVSYLLACWLVSAGNAGRQPDAGPTPDPEPPPPAITRGASPLLVFKALRTLSAEQMAALKASVAEMQGRLTDQGTPVSCITVSHDVDVQALLGP